MKQRIRELLEGYRLEEIAEWAVRRRRVLGLLISLSFDRDPLVGWRAVEAMGAAAERIADADAEAVRDHLRRLYWLLSEESGGVCWHAPEAMAEIVRRRPDRFGDYVPIIVSLLTEMAEEDLVHFRAGILWAIGRLGPIADGPLATALPAITACLDHPEAQIRGMAVWCLRQCGRRDLLAEREDLSADAETVWLYENGELIQTSVGQLIRQ